LPPRSRTPRSTSRSRALLRYAARTAEESLRLWSPPPALSSGRLDLLLPGAPAAIAAARAVGLAPVRRLAGGHAAAVGPGTLVVGWASPAPVLGPMDRRYAALAETIIEALRSLEVPARVGELDGEWCPGSWSILVGAGRPPASPSP
jgi:octanoyl-[GcvH]:protein N-octanoyltransferase